MDNQLITEYQNSLLCSDLKNNGSHYMRRRTSAGWRMVAGLAVLLMIFGCSQSDEISEQAAESLLNRYKTPLDDAKTISAKAQKMREAEADASP